MRIKSTLIGISLLLVLSCGQKKVETPEIEAHQPVLPVLAKKERNQVLKISMELPDSLQTATLTVFEFSLDGTTDVNDIAQATLLFHKEDNFDEAEVFGSTSDVATNFSISGNQKLSSRENHFWLSVELDGIPELTNKVAAHLVSATLSDGTIIRPENKSRPKPQRIGLALKQAGEDNIDTYRIPGLATTNKGTLIAVYDNRYNDPVDLQEDIDVGMSRSTDGGQSWEPMKVIMDMGEYGGLPENQNGIGDPAVLVDRSTNTIWVAALWLHGYPGERAWNASQPGMSPEETGQLMLVKSDDDGLTWSEPINITPQTKNPEWQLFFNGPGAGITMQDGTLVFAAQFKDKDRIPHATIIYSKDGGKSWHVGTGAKSETTEAQVVELSDGGLMLNMRDDRNRANRKDSMNGRSVAITKDLGKTWTEHATSRKALIEPNCMASIIAYDHPEKGKILFFSNPDSKTERNHITVKTSFDEGMTWPVENQVELYENGTYGYSCLTMVDDNHLGILYEGVKELYFQKIPLDELLSP
ncbi:MAG TPA: sialidase family protein [Pricia sp.]|nr:sialidase family protein [Pricia sp.]